jgi:M6 family metalloprotease-like protein
MKPLWLAAALLAQEPPGDLLRQERERLRSKAPLTDREKGSYAAPQEAGPLKERASYALAVVPVELADRKLGGADLGKLFFERVSGYFARASGGRFRLEGKVLAPFALDVERAKFADRDLEKALAARESWVAYDGVAFVVAGEMGARGTPLWPHKESLRSAVRTVDYILLTEELDGRAVGIAAHEVMHLLGFRDKYDDEKAQVGPWCILGTGYQAREPVPPCADCREKLGWTAPAAADPGRASRIVLEADPARAVRVPANPDATEYLLLEMRDRLFVWHVGGGKRIELVGRYPSEGSDRLTPLSDPPFRGRTVGARGIWITDIRVEDGKAWFIVGPEAAATALEEWRKSRVGKRLGD